MKKLVATLIMTSALMLSACQADRLTSSASKDKLTKAGYAVEVYGEKEAQVRIEGLNYKGVTFTDAVYAEKGKDDDKDLLVAFYFADINAASNFVSMNDNENLAILNRYADNNLGANLKKRVGTHNNVAYVGSETSFTAAFGQI